MARPSIFFRARPESTMLHEICSLRNCGLRICSSMLRNCGCFLVSGLANYRQVPRRMQISPIPRSAHEQARRCYWLPRIDAHCVPDRQRHSVRNCSRRQGNHLPQGIPEEGCIVGLPHRNCGLWQLAPIAMRARSPSSLLQSLRACMRQPLTACLLSMHRYCYENEP